MNNEHLPKDKFEKRQKNVPFQGQQKNCKINGEKT